MNAGARYPADSSAIKSSVARDRFPGSFSAIFPFLPRGREISRLTKEEITARRVPINRYEMANRMLRFDRHESCLSIARDRRSIAIISGYQRLAANIKDDELANVHLTVEFRSNDRHSFERINWNAADSYERIICYIRRWYWIFFLLCYINCLTRFYEDFTNSLVKLWLTAFLFMIPFPI